MTAAARSLKKKERRWSMKLNKLHLLWMFFAISTNISCQGHKENPITQEVKTDTTTKITIAPLDKIVEVGNSKPKGFKNTKPNKITRPEQLNNFFDTLTALKRPTRIVHIGDSHVRGHAFTVEARKVLENAWGNQAVEPQEITYKTTAIAKETGMPGLVYHALGKNGATCSHFIKNEYVSKVKELKPDLIIVSFGTNECHVKNYEVDAHKRELKRLLKILKDTCPQATIMLTTPGGAYFSYKHQTTKKVKLKNGNTVDKKTYVYSYKENHHTPTCVNTITTVANEKKLALWDMYAIGGGKEFSCKNWTGNKLMKNDHVHYTTNGYTVQGDLLAEAILRAYNDYLKRKKNAGQN